VHSKTDVHEMTMAEFKFIWRMEYAHRMWGRMIGVLFFVPAAVLLARRRFDQPMRRRMALCGVLLLGQVCVHALTTIE
jgi:cytochrome c oxidase assembly protein subunit 15